MSNILRPKENEGDLNKKLLSRSRVQQFARNAFGTTKAGVSTKSNGVVVDSTDPKGESLKNVPDHLTLLQLLALVS